MDPRTRRADCGTIHALFVIVNAVWRKASAVARGDGARNADRTQTQLSFFQLPRHGAICEAPRNPRGQKHCRPVLCRANNADRTQTEQKLARRFAITPRPALSV